MALDKLVDSSQLNSDLTSIANAIRAKTGGSSQLTLTEMAAEIGNIPTGITPAGSVTLTANGVYDVTAKAQAVVNVPFSSKCFKVTLNENKTGEIILNPGGDSDIAAHYAENGFTAALIRLSGVNELCILCSIAGNVNLRNGSTVCGGLVRANSSAVSCAVIEKAVSAPSTRIGGTLTVNSSGVVSYYGSSTIPMAAGNYLVICGWQEV